MDKLDKIRIDSIGLGKALIGPRKVNIHLNNSCNLKCIFCWYHSPLVTHKSRAKEEISYDKLLKLVDDCRDLKVKTISLESEGEALLYPKIYDLIKFIKGRSLEVELFTNCAYGIKYLKNLFLVDHIKVNFSAPNERLYKIIHSNGKGGYFNKVIRNLTILSRFRSRFHAPLIGLIYVINELNYKNTEDILKIAKVLKADSVSFKLIELTHETRSLMLKDESIKEAVKIIKKIVYKKHPVKNNLDDILRTITKPGFNKNRYSLEKNDMHNDRLFYYTLNNYNKMGCYLGWFYGFVDVKGMVLAPCDNVGVAVMGDINKESFKKIWLSDKFNKLRKEAKYKVDPNSSKWQECKYCGFVGFNQMVHKMTH